MKEPIRAPSARDVLKMDSGEAAQLMGRFSLQQQRELVLELEPNRRRQDLILLSPTPEALTRSLPPEDFALTVKEIGDQDALELIEMSSNAQLSYLLDLELWVRSDLDMQRLEHWLSLLLECGDDRAMRWVNHTDFALLMLLVERHCLPIEREALEQLPERLQMRVISPDDYHFLVVKVGPDLDLMRRLVDLIYVRDRERFFAIIGNLGTTPPAELEEAALRWRSGRLADRGWPDIDQALALYLPLDKKRLPVDEPVPAVLENPPRYALERCQTGRLLSAGLQAVTDQQRREALATQVANLINRAIIADGLPASELETLATTSKRVAGRLEIGLAELGVGDKNAAARVLETVPLLYLAQVAQQAIVQRRQRALRLLSTTTGDLPRLLAEPLPDRLSLLARARPVFLPAAGELPRDFASPGDLSILDGDMDFAEAAVLLAQGAGLSVEPLREPFPLGSHPESLEGLTLQTLLLTAFGRQLLAASGPIAPVPIDRLAELFAKMGSSKVELRHRLERFADGLLTVRPPGLPRLLDELAELATEQLLAHDPKQLDPRFVQGLWIVEEVPP